MTIRTRSVFYYAPQITENNVYINFLEPNADNVELTALLDVGSFSPTDLATNFENKLNQIGQNTYTVTLDRDTRFLTVSADDNFELLPQSGSNAGLGALPDLGFTTDTSGASSYLADQALGSEYAPQYFLQDYKDKSDNKQNVLSTVAESSSGQVEVVSFGRISFYEFNIRWITDKAKSNGGFLDPDPMAVQNARDFLDAITQKIDFEFMPDKNNRSIFDKVLLESTRGFRDGTGFELRELTGQGLDGYYETGTIKLRVLT